MLVFLHEFWLNIFALVNRSATAKNKAFCRNFGNNFTLVREDELVFVDNFTYACTVEVPLCKDFLNNMFLAFLYADKHTLLRFRKQNFPCFHIVLTQRNKRKVDFHTAFALCRHFGGRADDTCGAHVLHTDNCIGLCKFQRSFEQKFFLERVANLN